MLRNKLMCEDSITLFEQHFPEGFEITVENIIGAFKFGLFTYWFVDNFFNENQKEEYDKITEIHASNLKIKLDMILAAHDKIINYLTIKHTKAIEPCIKLLKDTINLPTEQYNETISPAYTEFYKELASVYPQFNNSVILDRYTLKPAVNNAYTKLDIARDVAYIEYDQVTGDTIKAYKNITDAITIKFSADCALVSQHFFKMSDDAKREYNEITAPILVDYWNNYLE